MHHQITLHGLSRPSSPVLLSSKPFLDQPLVLVAKLVVSPTVCIRDTKPRAIAVIFLVVQTSTKNVWPWSFLVPFLEKDLVLRLLRLPMAEVVSCSCPSSAWHIL